MAFTGPHPPLLWLARRGGGSRGGDGDSDGDGDGGGRGRAGGWRQQRMDSRVSELFGGCCRPGGGPALSGTLKVRGTGGISGCGGPKGKKKNGRNRGGKANNPPYLPPEVST